MRKTLIILIFACVLGVHTSNAQSGYTVAAGIAIDAGGSDLDYGPSSVLVGPSGKFFFAEEHAAQAEVLLGNEVVVIQAMYEYQSSIGGVEGLSWFAGGGPSIAIYSSDADVALRPIGGAEYKLNGAPVVFSFDWRPAIFLDGGGVEPARFGAIARYTFN